METQGLRGFGSSHNVSFLGLSSENASFPSFNVSERKAQLRTKVEVKERSRQEKDH
jgi:hypothetical protein